MSKSPGLYIDIGRKARDLLYKEYGQQPPNPFHNGCLDSSFDLFLLCETIVPGLSMAFRSIIPDSGRVELRYLHDYAGITAGIGLKANRNQSLGQDLELDPMVNFSGVTGNTLLSMGIDVGFDISTRSFNNYNAGLSINFLSASLTLNDKLDHLRAFYHQELIPLTRTAIAAELKHSFRQNGSVSDTIPTTLTVGIQHELFPSTLVKARVRTDGKVTAVVRKAFWQKLFIAISGETEFRGRSWIPNVGLTMAFDS